MQEDVASQMICTGAKSLAEYLEKFTLPIQLLQTEGNLEQFSYLLAKDLVRDLSLIHI